MLKRLSIRNFTAFAKADINFSKQINVIIGTNGMGKSHLLKLGYTLCTAKHEESQQDRIAPFKGEEWIGEKLMRVFNVERVGRLVRRRHGLSACDIHATFASKKMKTRFSFSTTAQYKIKDYFADVDGKIRTAICIPPKEVLSIYPGLAQAIEDRELSFDHVYYDLCKHLGRKPLRGKRFATIAELLNPIEQEVLGGGSFYEEKNSFFFSKPGLGKLEAPLVAEGMCKVGMLAHLLRNGSLVRQGTLFWDEPESNLNPQLLRLVARTISNLARHGVQVVIATHSLFLMRELDIINKENSLDVQFIGLNAEEDGVHVSQGDDIECLDNIHSLEAELEQSDRYMKMEFEND